MGVGPLAGLGKEEEMAVTEVLTRHTVLLTECSAPSLPMKLLGVTGFVAVAVAPANLL